MSISKQNNEFEIGVLIEDFQLKNEVKVGLEKLKIKNKLENLKNNQDLKRCLQERSSVIIIEAKLFEQINKEFKENILYKNKERVIIISEDKKYKDFLNLKFPFSLENFVSLLINNRIFNITLNPMQKIKKEKDEISILIIEDNPGDVRLIEEMLKDIEEKKFIFQQYDKLSDVMEDIDNIMPDIILLDLSLSDSWGISTFKKINNVNLGIPIIILSGNEDETIAIRAVQEGAQDYLKKGEFESNILEKSISYAIKRQKILNELEIKKEQLENYRQDLKNILDYHMEGIVIVNKNRKIIYINAVYETIFEKTYTEIVGKEFQYSFFPGEAVEHELKLGTNRTKNIQISSVQIMWQGERVNLISIKDITESKIAEKTQESLKYAKKSVKDTISSFSMILAMKNQNIASNDKKIAELAYKIGEYVGINSNKLEGLYVAGILHNVGRFFSSSDINNFYTTGNKVTPLKNRNHLEITYEILSSMNFPWNVAKIVYQHKELIDGSGYPLGLKGDEIIEEAKILSVATIVINLYKRFYSLGIANALEYIKNGKGRYYDEKIVDACLDIIDKGEFDLDN